MTYDVGLSVPLTERWNYIGEEWAAKERLWDNRIQQKKPLLSRQEYLETVTKKKGEAFA